MAKNSGWQLNRPTNFPKANLNLYRKEFKLSKQEFHDQIHDIKKPYNYPKNVIFHLDTNEFYKRGDVIHPLSGEPMGNMIEQRGYKR